MRSWAESWGLEVSRDGYGGSFWECTSPIGLPLEPMLAVLVCRRGVWLTGLVGELAPPDLMSPLAVRFCPCRYSPSNSLLYATDLCPTFVSNGGGWFLGYVSSPLADAVPR